MRALVTMFAMLTLATVSEAQSFRLGRTAAGFIPAESILNNSVTNLRTQGDTLWVGPYLNLTADGGTTWKLADADSLVGTSNRVFSIDSDRAVLWSGLGFVDSSTGDDFQSAGGFLFSEDGGETFRYRAPQLDSPVDTLIQYGVSTLSALAVIVPQQSPPFDIDYDPVGGEVWVAGWASGIRRSADNGASWQRVVLPPDDLASIHPDTLYDFVVTPRRGETGNLNHMGFSVLVDEEGTVWAGTPGGINRSIDGGISWRKFQADGGPNTLTGNWVISIEEQPVLGRNAIWMATWNAGPEDFGGRFGVTVTRDGGESFEQVLVGERVYDFAFADGVVYAASDNGLLITRDDGLTWTAVRNFANPPIPGRELKPDPRVFSVAVLGGSVWAGTSDGLFRSDDGGNRWEMFRVEVPLSPDEPGPRVPDVETFAYPNPFSPASDQFVRLRFDVTAPGRQVVSIYDYAMNLVRTLDVTSVVAGIAEATWDGTDASGLRVANGVYFYAIESSSSSSWGKILLIE
jgi:photosystem II stability/assembly factor-like uncharacterized protein